MHLKEKMPRTLITLIIFWIIAWFLFTYKLTSVPPGINGDEAAIGYATSQIAKTGYDTNGKFLPLFTTISWPDWKQPVTVYSTVAAFKIFGVSYFNIRAVSIFFVLISGTVIYFLAKEIFDKRYGILALILFTTIPIIMIQAHLAIENIAPLPFIAFWLLMLVKYSRQRKNLHLFLGSVALGLSIYSYLGLRLIVPVLTILSLGYILYLNHFKKSSIRPIIIFFLGLLPFLILAIAVKAEYPAAIFALNRPRNITSYQQFLLPYISTYDPSFLFLNGDSTPYHSTGKQGMFLLATLPLFLLGLFKIGKERKPIFIFTLLVFFLTPLLYGLPGSIYRASRLLVLIPPFIIIVLLGFKSLLEIKKEIFRKAAVFIIVTLFFINYIDFVYDYWTDYPNRVNQNFEKPLHTVFNYAKELSKKENLTVYIQDDAPLRNIPVYVFFENSYFPDGLKRWKEGEDYPPKSIIMVTEQVYKRIKISEYMEVKDYGSIDLNLLINKK